MSESQAQAGRHRHYSIDMPPSFCEECGKDWAAVVDGRKGRARRRARQAARSAATQAPPRPVAQPGGYTVWLDGNGHVVNPEDD